MARVLVTGGTGFIGSALVRALVRRGESVRVLDNDARGSSERLADVRDDVEIVTADVRDAEAVRAAAHGVERVCHLAYINGTEHFYSIPETVLDVGIRGMLNVIDACVVHGIPDLVVASSSEVYQSPPRIPTDESVPLVVPDPLNPRASYGGGKIASELLALNYGRRHIPRVRVFRPHNVYGPDMGWEHVIPQLAVRACVLARRYERRIPLTIQGTGRETRAFVQIDDLIAGVLAVIDRGEHLGIYHLGTQEEITIAELARRIAACVGREVDVNRSTLLEGSAPRRCPDIARARALGYEPHVPLDVGLPPTVEWYARNAERAPRRLLA